MTPAGAVAISVVIPTRNRPELLLRALGSALEQSLPPQEVIVVVDGPGEETRAALDRAQDDRVRIVQLPCRRGGAAARNAGIAAATAPWIALLDDDDEWLPSKLERQAAVAARTSAAAPVVACRTWYRTPTARFVLPVRLPSEGEDVGDYLLTRRSPFQGEGMVQTSMLLAPRTLFLRVPFREDLRRHHEWDWLLRADRHAGAVLSFVDEPLAIWHTEEARPAISKGLDWKVSLGWADDVRPLLNRRAYVGFLLTFVASMASRAGDRRAAPTLLRHALAVGRPTMFELAIFVGLWVIPHTLRLQLRRWLIGSRMWAHPPDTPPEDQPARHRPGPLRRMADPYTSMTASTWSSGR